MHMSEHTSGDRIRFHQDHANLFDVPLDLRTFASQRKIEAEVSEVHQGTCGRTAMKTVERWRVAFRNGAFRDQFLVSAIALPVIAVVLRIYLSHIETRPGTSIADPLLSLFPPVDLNWLIFAVLYSGLLLGLVSLLMYPYRFLLTMRALASLMLLRIAALFLFPLDTTSGGIPLADPIMQFPPLRFTGSHGLFFSWEVAVFSLLVFSSRWKDVKIIYVCAIVLLSVLLILQRAEYSIALLSGPCFAYAAFGFARFMTVRDAGEFREQVGIVRKATVTVRNN